MHRIMNWVSTLCRRRTNSRERQHGQYQGLAESGHSAEMGEMQPVKDRHTLKTLQGAVTSYHGDYGWIEGFIFFNADVVTSNVPLRVGQKVSVLVEEDEDTHGLKAIKVDAIPNNLNANSLLNDEIKYVVGRVTFVKNNIVYIETNFCFSITCVSEVLGFMPYKGDWLEVGYFMEPGTSKISVHSAKPIKLKHLEEVYITSLEDRHGMIDFCIFFTLDSLKVPHGYVPQLYDLVNIDMIESIQVRSVWRAISITPVRSA